MSLNTFGNSCIDAIYVVHAKTGYKLHENRIIELFKANNLEFQFVTDGDPSFFTHELLARYFTKGMLSGWSDGVISCTLNHLYAYEKMVEKNNRYALIFENDPFFYGNFNENIIKLADEINNLGKGFLISLENTSLRYPSYWAFRKGKHLYQAKQGRCAGAYIIDNEGAKRIINDVKINKCPSVIDWYHNFLIRDGILDMFWVHPPLVEQGSHNGKLCSTISCKQKSLSRQIKWTIQKVVRRFFKRFFKDKHIY